MKKLTTLLIFSLVALASFGQATGIFPRTTASGTNTYTATAPSGCTCASYVDGGRYQVLFTNANTSTSVTLAIHTAGSKTVYNSAGEALGIGEIKSLDEKILIYSTALNGFRIVGGGGSIDDDLTTIGNLTPSNDDVLQRKAGSWTNRTLAQLEVDIGTTNVDNTSDANKPVSTAQQTAIDGKVADAINNGTTDVAPSQNAVFDALALKVPTTRTITINGTTYDLSSDRTWSISTSSGVEFNVDSYGAVGNGVTDDSDAINLAVVAAGINGIIRLTPNKIYLQKRSITLLENQTIKGSGATLKRCAAEYTTLTANAAGGATSITVASSSIFRVGDTFIITNATSPLGGVGYLESSMNNNALHTITNITGNVITFTTSISLPTTITAQGYFAIGEKVVRVFTQVGSSTGTSGSTRGFTIEGVIFDGNRTNNTLTYAWSPNRCIGSMQWGSVIRQCVFTEMPNENIFPSRNCIIEDNWAYNLNGSFAHISSSSSLPLGYGNNIIRGNRILDSFQQFTANGRAAVIENSANSIKTYIVGNIVENCGGKFYGNSGNGTEQYIYNNICKNVQGIVSHLSSVSAVNSNHQIIGNIFNDCHYLLYQTSTTIAKGYGFDQVNVSNNEFSNVLLLFDQASNLTINSNTFSNSEGFTYSLPAEFNARSTGQINLNGCVNVIINNNTFEDKSSTLNARCTAGVICNTVITTIGFLKSDAVTSTVYAYSRNVKVSNNNFINYASAITDIGTGTLSGFAADVYQRNYVLLGYDFSGNTIYMRNTSDAKWGILAGPGVNVNNNTIYCDSNTAAGIRVLGANDGSGSAYSGTIRTAVNGAIVTNNKVYGAAIVVGNIASASRGENDYNCQVQQNYITHAITDNTGGNSTISGNITLTIAESPLIQRPRQNTGFY